MSRKHRETEPRSPKRFFQVFYQHGWVCLVVDPAHRSELYPEDILNRMRLLEMPAVERSLLQERIRDADGHAHRLIAWPEGARLEAVIETGIAEDEMSATLHITPPLKGAAPPTAEDLSRRLLDAGITAGIDTTRLEQIAADRLFGSTHTVARGTEPVFGSAHRIQYHFATDRGRPYLEMDFGRINLKELNFIEMVYTDQLLAELLPPIEPVDGRTVTGETIPAEKDDRNISLQPGPNTCLSEDRTQLRAACDGNVRLDGELVTVEPVVTVRNVDYATGNIHFDGSVVVEGGVADGFEIEAGGDIQIAHGVGRARLKAGRSILLQSGMNGNGSGSLHSQGDLFAKYLECCEVQCGGNLLLEEAIMHSSVQVQGHCLLNGRRAEIIGGDLVAGGCCWCKKLGNLNESPTSVTIGIPPDLVLEYRDTTAALRSRQEQLDEIRIKQQQLEQAVSSGLQNQRIELARTQLQEQADELNTAVAALRDRLPVLREQLESARRSMLVVEDSIYPAVSVWFGRQEYRAPDTGARKTILQFRGGKIRESGYDLRNKPRIDFSPEPQPE
ncbi:DUF342 domain-containing protein [Spirochaeta africana]|uniref:Putative polymerase with PALM domain, HD hydrolase domain and Zn ribbon n=1 Tax=Spirochaeta africana (strain ATCC 700263 / DSM 8902 / Z-7692) TaxID=889378 RepID=H9UGI7_SPIAZ|nr:FapA family protein [Spirochaeta africana]AFG36630.1 putative polymerase with PALM domain, HD hydrolase domain and Zn ribbon [Spirochaeta africana DSM 8902]